MTDKICSFCEESYDFDKGHDYDKCVGRCMGTITHYRMALANAEWSLKMAQAVQAQDWWHCRIRIR